MKSTERPPYHGIANVQARVLKRVPKVTAACRGLARFAAALSVLAGFAWSGSANSQGLARADIQGAREASIKRFLRGLDHSRSTRFVAAFDALGGRGSADAIVYLLGEDWCGSGGCDTLVLAPQGRSWRIVADISITRPPIVVLRSKSHGWHDLAVWVQGGGIQPGYEAELRFDGKAYPSNPTTPPARRLKRPAGKVVISSLKGARALYDTPPP